MAEKRDGKKQLEDEGELEKGDISTEKKTKEKKRLYFKDNEELEKGDITTEKRTKE